MTLFSTISKLFLLLTVTGINLQTKFGLVYGQVQPSIVPPNAAGYSQVSFLDAIGGAYSAIIPYNLGQASIMASTTTTSPSFFTYADINTASTVSGVQYRMFPVTCPVAGSSGSVSAICPINSFGQSVASPLTSQAVVLQSTIATYQGNPVYWDVCCAGTYLNNSQVLQNADTIPLSKDVWYFLPVSGLQNIYQIQGWNTAAGPLCVTANGSNALIVTTCQTGLVTQYWALYGVPLAGATVPLQIAYGYTQIDVGSVLAASTGRGTVVPYNLGVASMMATTTTTSPAYFQYVSIGNNAPPDASTQYHLNPVSCPASHTGVSAVCPIVQQISLPISNQAVVVQNIVGSFGGDPVYWDVCCGGTYYNGASVQQNSDNIPLSKDVFYFLPVIGMQNVYQIQGWDTANGVLCVTATGSGGLSLNTCQDRAVNQYWALYTDTITVSGSSPHSTPQIIVLVFSIFLAITALLLPDTHVM